MRILSDADTLLEVAPRENTAATSQAQILQQLFQAQRAQKMPPLQYLGAEHDPPRRGARLTDLEAEKQLENDLTICNSGQYEDRTHDLGVISTTL